MKWAEIRVLFEAAQPEQAEELVALAFHDGGLSGVLIEDPRLAPMEDWGPGAGPPSHHAVVGYLPRDDRLPRRQGLLEEALERLAKNHGIRFRVAVKSVDDEDWAETWKAYFDPIRITDRVVIKPTWRRFDPDPGDIVLELDPGMAFGTGSHATTAMCIQLLEKHLFPGATILDVGTGSGILMVTAGKLGAGRMVGIDNDPVAVSVARGNLQLNGIAPDRFGVVVGDLTTGIKGTFDLVLANILTEVVVQLLDDIRNVITPGGILVCSGIIDANKAQVERKLINKGFQILTAARQEEWVALASRRT